jgi:hypothetical protein
VSPPLTYAEWCREHGCTHGHCQSAGGGREPGLDKARLFLVRADSLVAGPAGVAIETEDAEAVGPGFVDPKIEPLSLSRLTVGSAVIVDVVESQKFNVPFATAKTLWNPAGVVSEHGELDGCPPPEVVGVPLGNVFWAPGLTRDGRVRAVGASAEFPVPPVVSARSVQVTAEPAGEGRFSASVAQPLLPVSAAIVSALFG